MAEYTGLKRTTDPALEPVSLSLLKLNAVIETSLDDALLNILIAAARGKVEDMSGASLITQTWRVNYRSFDGDLLLPRGPAQSITEIKYLDSAGVEQTLDASVYRLIDGELGPVVTLEPGQSWPVLYRAEDAVRVTVVTGYGATDESVPTTARQAVLLLASHYYRNREAADTLKLIEVPFGVKSLISSLRG